MGFLKFMQSQDVAGASVNLNLAGQTKYGTFCGGVASVCVKVVVLGFFVTQVLHLANYSDPQISRYEVYDDRFNQDKLYNLADMSV